MLTDVYSMLKAKQIRDLLLWTLAETHGPLEVRKYPENTCHVRNFLLKAKWRLILNRALSVKTFKMMSDWDNFPLFYAKCNCIEIFLVVVCPLSDCDDIYFMLKVDNTKAKLNFTLSQHWETVRSANKLGNKNGDFFVKFLIRLYPALFMMKS